jgi:hypothetical protein
VGRSTPGTSLVTGTLPGTSLVTGTLPSASTPGTTVTPSHHDEFAFCGLAVDATDRLFVPDPMHGLLLRIRPDGRLDARWPLPSKFGRVPGCIAIAGPDLYLTGVTAVLHLDLNGHLLARWPLPTMPPSATPPLASGITVSPDDSAVFALLGTQLYRLDPHSGAVTVWAANVPSSSQAASPAPTFLRHPPVIRQVLALGSDRVAVTDIANAGVTLYCGDGHPCAHLGQLGPAPGQLEQTAGLARDTTGGLYLADMELGAVERFTPAFRVTAVFWSPDDDEHEFF